MTADQAIIFAILGLSLLLFMWGRWRYDIVAFTALILAVISGVVPADLAFRGFGHPAVITVAGGRPARSSARRGEAKGFAPSLCSLR